MPGKWVNERQKRIYMKKRNEGYNQELAAAKAAFSTRTAKRIDSKKHSAKKIKEKKKVVQEIPFREFGTRI